MTQSDGARPALTGQEGAMPATPKHPSVRARRNKVSTAATLVAAPAGQDIPDLPDDREWHPQTVLWWVDVWRSPMAAEFDSSDVHGLLILAVLVDGFWLKPHWTAAAEIRLQGQRFGLSPIDRRRLQWEIEKVDEAQDRGQRRRGAAPKKQDASADPRSVLRAV
jgi:hypothetical protein